VKLVYRPWWSARYVRNWFTRILMKQSHKPDMMYLTLNNCPLPATNHSQYKWHFNTSFFIDTLHFSETRKINCTFYSGVISPTRCNNCVFYSQRLYSTCFRWQSHPSSGVQRVKPLRIKNTIVASCWTYFTTIKHDARNHKY